MNDPRVLVIRVLKKIEDGNGYAVSIFDKEAKRSTLTKRQIAFAHEIVFGVLRNKRYLIYSLPLKGNYENLHPLVKRILLIGAYEILFLKNVSVNHSVNFAVNFVKNRLGLRMGGLVNGVLRALSRDPKVLLPKDPIKRLGIKWSLPDWLAKRLIKRFGEQEAWRIAKGLSSVPEVVLRVNLSLISRESLMNLIKEYHPQTEVRKGKWASSSIIVKGMGDPIKSPLHRKGLFAVQDEGSQIIGMLASPKQGERILDACSGAGGKSLMLYDLSKTPIYAIDIDPKKILNLKERAFLSHFDIHTRVLDLSKEKPNNYYDLALVDAPCTGLGVLRRNPEARWRIKEEDIYRFSKLQSQILQNVSQAIKPRGRLLYVVCTFTKEETIDVIENFLTSNTDFMLEDIDNNVPKELVNGKFLNLFSHLHSTDAFFAALLKRKEV